MSRFDQAKMLMKVKKIQKLQLIQLKLVVVSETR